MTDAELIANLREECAAAWDRCEEYRVALQAISDAAGLIDPHTLNPISLAIIAARDILQKAYE